MFGLCTSHYLSAPGLSQDAMLKMTKIKLELPQDPVMYILQKSIRGGISNISNRYSKVKSKDLKFYDQKQESKHIIYLDANNLFGFAMSKYLPKSIFKWMDSKEFDLNKFTSNSFKGWVLEVNLEYPKKF